ncbi:MAG: Mrp/NBP35 family ATP-binding protein [Oscillospiraceae bacterium]|nr:Mrp/NBP35 family ATP-binding protein [Oscillospiraceae bacterium]
MDECTHDCSSCGSDCPSKQSPESLLAPMNQYSNVKNVIAVVSGKGGVGKSLVTSLMACRMQHRTKKTAVLDADITGPSIPKIFGIEEQQAMGDDHGLLPLSAKNGLKIMSINSLLPDKTSPVLWRGPVISGVVKQFWTEVCWGDVDYMFVDMPPGTGDVPLTVFQSLPVKGIIIVTSPQELVGMIVEKAVNMAEMMNVPVLGIVENMSYFECPECGARHAIFGESHVDEIAAAHGIDNVAKLPMDPAIAAACDSGDIGSICADCLAEFAEKLAAACGA